VGFVPYLRRSSSRDKQPPPFKARHRPRTYIEEYHLTPDELIAKAFRMIQSPRPGYYPNGKSEWIRAVRKLYEKDGKVFAGHLQDEYKFYMNKAFGFSVIGTELCLRRDLIQERCGCADYGITKESLRKYAACEIENCPSTPNT
jgi:hypothetical protein